MKRGYGTKQFMRLVLNPLLRSWWMKQLFFGISFRYAKWGTTEGRSHTAGE